MLLLGAATLGAQEIDNCATLLGSLSRELHIARALAPGQHTTFTCPREREARAAVGASRQRVLNALGTPDQSSRSDNGATVWTYAFRSRLAHSDERGGGPELSFRFNVLDQVAALECHRSR